MKLRICVLLCLAIAINFMPVGSTFAQEKAELAIAPDDYLILNPTNEGKRYYDTVIHSIAVSANSAEPITIDNIEVSFLYKGSTVLSKHIPAARIVGESQGISEMVQMGLSALLNAQVLNEEGLSGLFNRETRLGGQAEVTQNEALLTTRHHFSLDFVPDEALITVAYKLPNGQTDQTAKTIPVHMYESPVSYSSPLNGIWLATANAGIETHHRLNPGTEYAIDFFKLDVNGQIHNGDDRLAENYFGFGSPVMAAADGEVVLVISDVVQNRALLHQQPDETEEEAQERLTMLNFKNMAEDFPRATAGNLVVIKHEVNGHIEYSSYGHLAPNSITVSVGDTVKRGEVVGKVGDTGDSDTVHLHFQVNAGPDPFTSKSLPINFTNLTEVNPGADPLKFVSGNTGLRVDTTEVQSH